MNCEKNPGPLFSILMASYNNGHFLPEAIASVKAQNYQNWELIIVDDASTDNSWDVIIQSAKSDERIRVFRNETNLKVGATKRRCVSLAAGDICGILDPDDALSENALEIMVEAHGKHPECALIYSTHWLCNEFLEKVSLCAKPQMPGCGSYLEQPPGNIHHFWTFKKSFYTETEGFAEKYLLAEDQDLFYKLEEVGKVMFVDVPLYFYRLHEGGMSSGSKTAIAFSWHIQAMQDALSRRRRQHNSRFDLCYAKKLVAYQIVSFMDWGSTKISSRRMVMHLLLLLQLQPSALFSRKVLRVVKLLLKSTS